MSKKEIEMGIVGIKEQNLDINYPELERIGEIDPKQLNVNIGANIQVGIESDSALVTVGAMYIYSEVNLFTINVINKFIVKDIKELVDDSNKLEKGLITTLLDISIGNLRGIISTKTISTKLEAFPLVIVDLKEFIPFVDVVIV
ncbi:hypothetical protein LJB87_00160 [Alistipes sp. OttesenSCG-928-L06]|nr:hypothetical protein [Alistipes sp. OttesenSCG-928-L06]